MEKILFVKNGELDEVNDLLSENWHVKEVNTCSNEVSQSGGANLCAKGDVFAYIVLTKYKDE